MQSETGGTTLTADIVRVTVPRSLEYIRLLRLCASAFAARLGYDVDEIDDVRRAVDELATIVVDSDTGGELEVVLHVAGGVLSIEGSAPARVAPAVDDLAAQILTVLVDRYDTGCVNGRGWFRCEKPLPAGG